MATNLKTTDVVIVGLGAAGGVAALPLAQAGLEVVGLEAGTWLRRDDFAPDELRNNFRGWPQSVQKANREVPTHRPERHRAPYSPRPAIHPMMNAVGGTTLHYWAQSWRLNPVGLQGRQRDDAALRRLAHPDGIDRRGLAVRPRGARAVLRQGRARARRVGQGRQHQRQDRSARQHLRRAAAARVPDAAAARHRVHRDDGDGGADARLASVPRPAAINSQHVPEPAGVRVSRLLQPRRLPRQREGLDGGHTIPKAQKTGRLDGRHRGARHHRSTSTRTAASPASPTSRTARVLPAGRRRAARELHLRERRGCCCCRSRRRFPNGLSNNHGQVGRHYISHNQGGGVTALFPRDLNNWYGLPAQGVAVDDWADDNFDHAGLDFIGGGNLWVYSDRRPIGAAEHEHVRPGAALGLGVEGVRQGERRSLAHRVPAEDDAAVRGQLSRSRSGREGSAWVSRCAGSRRITRTTSGRSPRSSRTRWSSGIGGRRDRDREERRSARWARRRTPTAARAWATTPRRTSSTDGASRTRRRTSAMLGASVMGTSGARNPTLTAQALAWRTAEHLAKNWKSVV